MQDKKNAKVIPFPRALKAPVNKGKGILDELKAVLTDSTPIPPPERKRDEDQGQTAQSGAMSISGTGNQVATSGGIINNFQLPAPVKPIVVVQTGVGTINAQQKRRLLDLRDDVVAASAAGAKPKTPGGVMLGLNKYMKVNTYSEILAVDFEKAVKWLMRQRAIKTSLRSAPKKLPDWRNRRIKAIHARCKDRGWDEWRLGHMKKKFGVESMIELCDADLEALYRTVMSKK